MNTLKQHIDQNLDRYLKELFGLLSIPSVSSQHEHVPDMHLCASHYAKLLEEIGMDKVSIHSTDNHPVVYAEKMLDTALETILVYGHYDVQPAEPFDLWISPPFEPEVRNGAIYARGANDDKGQSFMHLKALEYLMEQGLLHCNVRILLEGEEEIGSPSLAKWAETHKEMLACDLILVSDTTMIAEDTPSINCGMRGLAYIQIKVTGPDKDLHSGHYGGAITNPILALSQLLSGMLDAQGRITVPGFYDQVIELSDSDRALLAKAPFSQEEFNSSISIREEVGEEGYTTKERIGIRPCLDVCGIWGGYTGEGAKTVLPSYAQAKISARLVPNQDYRDISQKLINYLKTNAPKGVTVEVWAEHGGQGFLTPISSRAYQAASNAIQEVYGIEPVPSRGGGSIPVLADLQNILNANPLLMGFGLERDTIHSPNESFLIRQFTRGIESLIRFYLNYQQS